MTQTVSYKFEFAVGYLNSPNEKYGSGANIEISIELMGPTQTQGSDVLNVLKPLDHKHLHLESPQWRKPEEPLFYGFKRVLQVVLFLLGENSQIMSQFVSIRIETGLGQVLLFEQEFESPSESF